MPRKISRKHAATLESFGYRSVKVGRAVKRQRDLASRNRKGRN